VRARNFCHLDAERAAQTVATPESVSLVIATDPNAVKLRLTLFLQPNHRFGESFRGSGGRRPHDCSHAALEPA
jgi:hypothetical protein